MQRKTNKKCKENEKKKQSARTKILLKKKQATKRGSRRKKKKKAHREVGELPPQVNDRLVGALDVGQGADHGPGLAHVKRVQDLGAEHVAVENRQTAGGGGEAGGEAGRSKVNKDWRTAVSRYTLRGKRVATGAEAGGGGEALARKGTPPAEAGRGRQAGRQTDRQNGSARARASSIAWRRKLKPRQKAQRHTVCSYYTV